MLLLSPVQVEIAGGSLFAFGLFSHSLKTTMGYSQGQIDTLSFAQSMSPVLSVKRGPRSRRIVFAAVGNYAGIIAGIIFDRWGVCATVVIGSILNSAGRTPVRVLVCSSAHDSWLLLLGYLGMWLGTTKTWDIGFPLVRPVAASLRTLISVRSSCWALLRADVVLRVPVRDGVFLL